MDLLTALRRIIAKMHANYFIDLLAPAKLSSVLRMMSANKVGSALRVNANQRLRCLPYQVSAKSISWTSTMMTLKCASFLALVLLMKACFGVMNFTRFALIIRTNYACVTAAIEVKMVLRRVRALMTFQAMELIVAIRGRAMITTTLMMKPGI